MSGFSMFVVLLALTQSSHPADLLRHACTSRNGSWWDPWRSAVEETAAFSSFKEPSSGDSFRHAGTISPCFCSLLRAAEHTPMTRVRIEVETSRVEELFQTCNMRKAKKTSQSVLDGMQLVSFSPSCRFRSFPSSHFHARLSVSLRPH